MAEKNPFLTAEQEQEVVDAIARAEKITSGEVRVHLEEKCSKDPLKRAGTLFHKLKMDQTRDRNGVLIYVATEDRKLAVFGGKGIYDQVGHEFWEDVIRLMEAEFREGNFKDGLVKAVGKVAEKLKELYPYRSDDVDELKNEISYGEPSGQVAANKGEDEDDSKKSTSKTENGPSENGESESDTKSK